MLSKDTGGPPARLGQEKSPCKRADGSRTARSGKRESEALDTSVVRSLERIRFATSIENHDGLSPDDTRLQPTTRTREHQPHVPGRLLRYSSGDLDDRLL
jgi:hypothetical protein